MAANPVSAFLAGFQAVDQLETNRQARDLRNEQQSRLRTIWDRQDQEFERNELKRIQGDNLTKFDATVRQVVEEVGGQVDKVRQAHIDAGNPEAGEQAASALSAEWFGNDNVKGGRPAGFTRVANEAVKRMIAANPEFGEHIALTLGIDAQAGSLVRDKTKPVSGVVLVPGELDPSGEGGGAIVEIDATTGKQPATDNRSSAGNDPVTIGRLGLPQLTDLFGEGVMGNDFLVSQQIRGMLPNGGQPTGNPLDSQDRVAPVSPAAAAVRDTAAEAAAALNISERDANGVPLSAVTAEDLASVEGGGGKELNQPPDEGFAPQTDTALLGQESTDQLADTVRATVLAQDPPQGTPPTFNSKGIPVFAPDVAEDTLPIAGDTPFGTKIGPIRTTKEINEDSGGGGGGGGGKVSDFTPRRVSANPDAAIERAPIFAEQAVQPVAKQVLQDAQRPGRPTVVETYNAVGLARLGIISREQLVNYASTGSLNPAATKKLQTVTAGGFARSFDPVSGQFGPSVRVDPTAGVDTEEPQTDLEIFETQKTLFENRREFQDRDGKPDETRVQRALEQVQTASQALGLSKEAQVSRSVLTSLNQGQLFVDRFSADESQTFDFNPFSDPELGPNNMALGFVADQMGVTSQDEADRFLFDYGITFRNAFPRMSQEDIIRNVITMEREARGSDSRTKIVADTIEKAKKSGN